MANEPLDLSCISGVAEIRVLGERNRLGGRSPRGDMMAELTGLTVGSGFTTESKLRGLENVPVGGDVLDDLVIDCGSIGTNERWGSTGTKAICERGGEVRVAGGVVAAGGGGVVSGGIATADGGVRTRDRSSLSEGRGTGDDDSVDDTAVKAEVCAPSDCVVVVEVGTAEYTARDGTGGADGTDVTS